MSTAYDRLIEALEGHGSKVNANGVRAKAQCPAHEDRAPSLSLARSEGQALVYCHAGCQIDDVLAALDLSKRDLFDEPKGATYTYDDGRLVHRSPAKQFWQTNIPAGTAQLYRLANVDKAIADDQTVYVVEGEKDVHALETLGVVATCSPMGAGKWSKVDPTPLHGGKVVVVADLDGPGENHARDVLDSLAGMCQSMRLVHAKAGKDAADHVAAGYGVNDFEPWDETGVGAGKAGTRPWQPVDLTAVLDGTWKAPQPTVGQRSDGVGLFYPGKVHTVASESEAGKTWFALAAAADEINAGNHVVYLDFEDNENGVASRLLTLGLHRDRIREQFHYLNPADPLGTGINLDDLTLVLTEHGPTFAVVDGITEAMTLHGLNPLDNVDVAAFGRILPRRIAAHGPAVACLDHVTKAREGRGRYAIGGAHKLNGLDGAAYVLDNRTPFGIGLTGRSTIKIAKDRPGQLRRHGLPSSGGMHWFGDLVLDSRGEEFAEVGVSAPVEHSDTFRPTVMMARVAAVLAEHGPLAQRRICVAATGKRESLIAALDFLILDGYVSDKSPHVLLKPYDGSGEN